MSRDLAQFLLPLSAQGEPGLSPLDTRLNTITDLAEQRKFKEAADHAEKLLEEQIYDIRPISILFYQAFLEDGFGTLRPIFAALGALLGSNLPAVGPLKRREDQLNRRMVWLFDAILDACKYHQTKRTENWERWTQASSPEQLSQASQEAGELVPALGADAFKGAHTALSRVMEWLRGQQAAFQATRAAPPPSTAAPSAASSSPRTPAAAMPSPATPVSLGSEAPVDPMTPVRRRVELEVSHQFIELWVKLQAFETLIAQKKLDRAALVAQDLMHIIEHFDPRAFFPGLFTRFSVLMSKNIGALTNQSVDRDSEQWKAMEQHYRVDLEGFLEG